MAKNPSDIQNKQQASGFVGPAPSPVNAASNPQSPTNPSQPPPDTYSPKARQAPHHFRRHMPHYEGWGNPVFVTFATIDRIKLPTKARRLILDHILHDHFSKMELSCAVVMPDHVHLLYYPWCDAEGNRYTKTEIVGAIKSVSARGVNAVMKRKGPLWQDESFDHVTRCAESVREKSAYIVANPVRAGLCRKVDDYPYLWRSWVEGMNDKK